MGVNVFTNEMVYICAQWMVNYHNSFMQTQEREAKCLFSYYWAHLNQRSQMFQLFWRIQGSML